MQQSHGLFAIASCYIWAKGKRSFQRCPCPFFVRRMKKKFAFEAPFVGLGATYAVHLRLIGELVGDFLLVIIELFSLGAFVLSQFTRLTDGLTDGRTDAHRKDRVAYNTAR